MRILEGTERYGRPVEQDEIRELGINGLKLNRSRCQRHNHRREDLLAIRAETQIGFGQKPGDLLQDAASHRVLLAVATPTKKN